MWIFVVTDDFCGIIPVVAFTSELSKGPIVKHTPL